MDVCFYLYQVLLLQSAHQILPFLLATILLILLPLLQEHSPSLHLHILLASSQLL